MDSFRQDLRRGFTLFVACCAAAFAFLVVVRVEPSGSDEIACADEVLDESVLDDESVELDEFDCLTSGDCRFAFELVGDAEAQALTTQSCTFECPAYTRWNPDGGPTVNGMPNCGSDVWSEIRAETLGYDAGSKVYFCGTTGCTQANFRTAGYERCRTCLRDSYRIRGRIGTARCISNLSDASLTITLTKSK